MREGESTGGEPVKVTEAQVMAANLTIEINDKLGRETPQQIVRLANAPRTPRTL